MTVLIVYDDSIEKSELISDIIGDRSFGEVMVRKKHLEDDYREKLCLIYSDIIWKKISKSSDYIELEKLINMYDTEDIRIIHCFSDFIINDFEKAELSLKKIFYIDDSYGVLCGNHAAAAMFLDIAGYRSFLKNIITGQSVSDAVKKIADSFQAEGFLNVGEFSNFIKCITGDFDSRYFNSLVQSEYTVVKSSSNKEKIRAEYEFYYLLPDDMKYWFVQPFDYKEDDEHSSYRMERLYMADLSIKWVHGSMKGEEFKSLMEKYFFFFSSRHSKDCSMEEYNKKKSDLYVKKINERIEKLKEFKQYSKIESMLYSAGIDIDALANRYFQLKKRIEEKTIVKPTLVIGHGDPCFANAIYNKATRTLKFIDPKGARSEDELWTDPYYDVAKLSHSVCGRYDFFNNDLYDIFVDKDFSYKLDIPFDGKEYIKTFRDILEKYGYNYYLVRIYEVSLFLSMLPLHMDNPHKVFGFIINAKEMMDGIEEELES